MADYAKYWWVCEITLAVVLLIGAGLMITSVVRLYAVDRGLNTNSVLTKQVVLPKAKYPGGRQVASFYERYYNEFRLCRASSLPV